ncbi:MAG: hypothetical protein DRN17_07870 [Thermoplasmata archaeon]|nr:MAG: hypothetical protein DRN17_07870 [Thermoplasmata archaeon]
MINILVEFMVGIIIGVFGGGVVITLLAILIGIVSEHIYKQRIQEAIKEHNRYIEKKYNEFIKLRAEFLKFKKKLTKQVEKHDEIFV